MKKFVFYICVFAIVSFAVDSIEIGSDMNEDLHTCLTENNMSSDDLFTSQNIVDDQHKSESQEKIQKNGCIFQCMFQKAGLMEGSEYDIEKMHDEFKKDTQPGEEMFEALNNCINETKDLTEKCEKSFALMECTAKVKNNILLQNKLREEFVKNISSICHFKMCNLGK